MQVKIIQVTEKEIPGLGERIKAARKATGRPLHAVAAAASMSPQNWYRIEKEEAKSIPIETLRAVESALGVDFGVTMEPEPSPEPPTPRRGKNSKP
jgi:transcriptional regulator with XRE-family HTH domain